MFISLSSTKAELYEWFTYYGRKKTFEDHHKKYDLTLEPKDRFGIRKLGQKYKLVDASDTSTLFTFSDKEVKLLIKRSKGFGGKVDGKKAVKGRGGLDTPKRRTTSKTSNKPKVIRIGRKRDLDTLDADEGLPSVYPDVPIPPTKSDIKRLFNALNKHHFNNRLRPDTKIQTMVSRQIHGKATTEWVGDTIIKQGIRLSKSILFSRKRLINVLLHEMVHLHHKIIWIEDGREEYDEKHIRNGHGPMFVRDIRELNSRGFSAEEYTADDPKDEMDHPVYALYLYGNDTYTGVYFDKSFKSKVESIVDKITNHFGSGVFSSYAYMKTTNPRATTLFRLTNKQDIPKNVTLRIFKNVKVLSSILEETHAHSTKIKVDHKTAGASPEIVNIVSKAQKIRHTGFNYMAVTAMYYSGISEYVAASKQAIKSSSYNEDLYAKAVLSLTDADKEYLHNYWVSIPDDVFYKNKDLNNRLFQPIAANLHRMKHREGLESLSIPVKETYTAYFKGRRTVTEFRNIFELSLVKQKLNNAYDIHNFTVELFGQIQW